MEKMVRKKVLVFLVSFLFSVMIINTVSAVSLGVSPATLDFKAAPGSSVEKPVLISTSTEGLLKVSISSESELGDWISFKPSSDLSVKRGSPLRISIKVKVPRSADERIYEDIITVTATSPVSTSEGGTGSRIVTGVAIKTSLKVSSDIQVEKSKISAWGITAGFLTVVLVVILIALLWLRRKRR